MSSGWNRAAGGLGKSVRWSEEGDNEKSIYLGTVVQGIYVGRSENVGVNRSTVYELELENGDRVSVWGTTVIDAGMAAVERGMEVRIEFVGMRTPKKGGKDYRNFTVDFRAPEGTTTTSEPETESISPEDVPL